MKHFYKDTEGESWFNYEQLYSDIIKESKDGAHFVEVGSWKGKSACFMAVEIINSGKDIKFDCVDTWSNLEYQNDIKKEKYKNLFEIFKKNIKLVEHKINIVRKISWEAASRYKNESLDFVFLDAGHDYESAKKDINAWLPKVKVGGVLAGHDYQLKGIQRATASLLNAEKVQEVITDPKSPHWSSWKFIK